MVFAQLTWREMSARYRSLLEFQIQPTLPSGTARPVHRATLADANEQRDWRIYADLAQFSFAKLADSTSMIHCASRSRRLSTPWNASIINLGLSLCPWARFDRERAALKLHTQLDLRGSLPAAVQITPAKTQEVTWLDALTYEPGAFYLMDRGYVDYRAPSRD